MKTLLFYTTALFILLSGIGCEMHPPSETVKDHKTDDKEHAAEEKKPEAATSPAPTYFKN